MIIDIHSHIVPNVDDGSESLKESETLLQMLKKQGVEAAIATPHFNEFETNIEEYKQKVLKNFSLLKNLNNIPELFLGYEFKYFRGMSTSGLPERFCLGNSNFILIELPYENISEKALEEILKLRYNNNLRPILAHIDRYAGFKNYKKLLNFLQKEDILAQINADSIYCENYKKNSLKLMKSGIINFVGSDTHSVEKRPPNIDKFLEIANKKAPLCLDAICHNNKILYKSLKA